jgi:hypothetical protein
LLVELLKSRFSTNVPDRTSSSGLTTQSLPSESDDEAGDIVEIDTSSSPWVIIYASPGIGDEISITSLSKEYSAMCGGNVTAGCGEGGLDCLDASGAARGSIVIVVGRVGRTICAFREVSSASPAIHPPRDVGVGNLASIGAGAGEFDLDFDWLRCRLALGELVSNPVCSCWSISSSTTWLGVSWDDEADDEVKESLS